MTPPSSRLLAPLLLLPVLGGCYDSSAGSLTAPSVAPLSAELTAAADCDDLLTRLRADAKSRVETQAWRLAESYSYFGPSDPGPVYDAGIAAPSVDFGADSAGGGVPRHTETNTQVAGVDETDFVETDGVRVYLLHDRQLLILDAAPVGAADELARVDVEGTPRSMFVDGGRAVIFSDLWTYGTGGLPVPAGDSFPYWGATVSETKVTVLDVTTLPPSVVSEHYIEGTFVDARRHDDVVRALVQFDGLPSFEWRDQPSPYDASGGLISRSSWLSRVIAWRDARLAEVDAAALADFLPDEARSSAGTRSPVPPRCDRTYVPEPGQIEGGLLSVLTFSTATPEDVDATTILGRASVMYASVDWLVVSQADYRYVTFRGVPTQESVLHAFSLAGEDTTYADSIKVRGSVPNQFALDEDAGVLRVTTQETNFGPVVSTDPEVFWAPPAATQTTYVSTFALAGNQLSALGQSPPLAPDEQLRAVRYVDERGYVVTFRQVDPLFVIDLSNPATPTVLGELEIPGFSTYMHPLDADHLLTIGTDVDPMTNQTLGLALQIFDVSVPTAPTLAHKTVIGSASSLAQYDHKAFVFDAETGILAIPVESYGVGFRSGLELYDVSVSSGISSRGAVEHTIFYDDCNDSSGSVFPIYECSYPATMRRGLFIGDHVYAISHRAVTTHPVSDLATTTDTYVLPMPTFTYDGLTFLRAL